MNLSVSRRATGLPLAVAIVAVLAVAALGCSAAGGANQPGKWTGEAATLVVYAQQVPLYPGAKAEDAMGSDSYGDTPEEHSEGMSIWFKVEGYDKAKVLAWYEERLSGYQRSTLDDDTVELRMPAPGGEPGEEVGVWIDDDGFRVFEDTKPGKHRG
jgi:hypothetical protein